MKMILKLHPLSVIGCLISITGLGLAIKENSLLNNGNSETLKSTTVQQAKLLVRKPDEQKNQAVKTSLTPLSPAIIGHTDPALADLMRAIVLQSLESGVYTLLTLPSELKPFAPRNFGAATVADSDEKNTEANDENSAEIEAKFAEMSADDYVPPEPEYQCPDPYDLPSSMRNSRNIETLKEHGCEIYMEDQQVQVQIPNTDSGDNDTAMYDASI